MDWVHGWRAFGFMGYTFGMSGEGGLVPWKELSVIDQRFELVGLIGSGMPVAAAARVAGVSRKTATKWWVRFQAEGSAGLSDRSRARLGPTSWETDAQMVGLVLRMREKFPTWGGRKIAARLVADGFGDVPAPSTITEILRRHGLLAPLRGRTRDWLRFEAEIPNDLWQMDFKGDFGLTAGGRCYPLTVIDDHSRFVVGLEALGNQQRTSVQEKLVDVFAAVGTPLRILCDHGPPWGASGLARFTGLGVWLIENGVEVIHGRPQHPQTQGKDERFHRTLLQDVLATRGSWDTISAVQDALDTWKPVYNTYRPHQALDMAVPADRYQPSPRTFDPNPKDPIYPNSKQVRVVDQEGRISWKGTEYRVGHPFAHKPVYVESENNHITVRYYTTIVKTITQHV
jgi:transposase InsO family protein